MALRRGTEEQLSKFLSWGDETENCGRIKQLEFMRSKKKGTTQSNSVVPIKKKLLGAGEKTIKELIKRTKHGV
jgi:hypothetical protein